MDYADKSKEDIAREFSVDAKRIQVWCKQKDNVVALKTNGNSRSGGSNCVEQDKTC